MRIRALIIDDEPAVRRLLWSLCDGRGYETFTFPDPGFCPLHVVHTCPCPNGTACTHIILTDVKMLRVNGLEFIAALQKKGCRVPFVGIMSGSWLENDRERADDLGCRLFDKPFRVDEVTAWLQQVESRLSPAPPLYDWLALNAYRARPLE
jgi:CheY-like chemotaxis protein